MEFLQWFAMWIRFECSISQDSAEQRGLTKHQALWQARDNMREVCAGGFEATQPF